MFSLALEARLRVAAAAEDDRARIAVAAMMARLARNGALLDDPAWLHARLSDIIACDGVLISNRGLIAVSGDTPDSIDLIALMDGLDAAAIHAVVATDPPFTAFWEEPHLAPPAGILAIPIERAPRDCVMLSRHPRSVEQCWGGDPDAIVARAGSNSGEIGPRTDFRPFLRAEPAQSLRFSPADCRAAEAVRVALTEAALREAQREASAQRHVAERHELAIDELNHRVRNILALIRGLIGRTAVAGIGTADYVAALGGRVQALPRAHDHAVRPDPGPAALSLLVEDEIAAFSPTARDRLRLTGPAIILTPRTFSTLALVMHELVTNSVKYGALSADGSIDVHAALDDHRNLIVRWREHGAPF